MSYIYIINAKETDFYKIGMTKDVKIRLSTIQSCCPIDLEIINFFKVENPRFIEQLIHTKYSKLRKRGEWFTLNSEQLLEVMSEIKDLPIIECSGGYRGFGNRNDQTIINEHKEENQQKTNKDVIIEELKKELSYIKSELDLSKEIIEDSLYNIYELSYLICIDEDDIRKLISSGKIKAKYVGDRFLFRGKDVIEFIHSLDDFNPSTNS